jgi:hypothetical protein
VACSRAPTHRPRARGSPRPGRSALGALQAFDPDRLLDRLEARLKFCFTPFFVAGSALLIVWALVTVARPSERDRRRSLAALELPEPAPGVVAVLTVTTLHEFAHGLTCKHFGGHVHEMGFLLIYLQPAFYCNISDAWLFSEKSQRLWVTFAGAFFEMTLWGLATLVWRLTEPAHRANDCRARGDGHVGDQADLQSQPAHQARRVLPPQRLARCPESPPALVPVRRRAVQAAAWRCHTPCRS